MLTEKIHDDVLRSIRKHALDQACRDFSLKDVPTEVILERARLYYTFLKGSETCPQKPEASPEPEQSFSDNPQSY